MNNLVIILNENVSNSHKHREKPHYSLKAIVMTVKYN